MEPILEKIMTIFPVVILAGMFIIIGAVILITRRFSVLNPKYKEKVLEFVKSATRIRGVIDDCIVFWYETSNGEDTLSYHMYLPVIKYLNEDNEYELVALKGAEIDNFGSKPIQAPTQVKYEDIGKRITVACDRFKVEQLEIDLDNGIFLGQKLAGKIEIGDSAQARRGVFSKTFSSWHIGKIYLFRDEPNFLEYTKNIRRVYPGIIVEIEGEYTEENFIERSAEKSKKIFKTALIVGAIVFAVVCIILMFLMKAFVV